MDAVAKDAVAPEGAGGTAVGDIVETVNGPEPQSRDAAAGVPSRAVGEAVAGPVKVAWREGTLTARQGTRVVGYLEHVSG